MNSFVEKKSFSCASRVSITSNGAEPRAAINLARFACGLPVTNSIFPPSASNLGTIAVTMFSFQDPPQVATRRVTPSNWPAKLEPPIIKPTLKAMLCEISFDL